MDLWGSAPFPSTSDFHYYVAFSNAYSKYTWIYFIKNKSETLHAFKLFHKFTKSQFNTTIKVVQSNFGGEFRSFTEYLIELGVSHRLRCPHTYHQSGTVECKHKHIVEMGLTLLFHVSLPLHFWEHSFASSVHVISWLPIAGLAHFQSPFFALYCKYPLYDALRVFACLCFTFTCLYNKHKLDFQSHEFVHLGVSSQHKGYKYLRRLSRICISKGVIFHEDVFPYPTLFSTPTCEPSDRDYHTESIPFPSIFEF